ncbi:hypothetical protein [Bacillus sp. V59.32b]|uniref:hypothetical protein n=1 Tax=Bacillus sp. V59.32b TaxID=1758642 RepID=UPI000E3E9A02|nr:hypothetical protein [Bacillus sp. V59.32b]RFU62206.1 hypothetical protein D0463_13585 [Bacillus sp. V59.32b]
MEINEDRFLMHVEADTGYNDADMGREAQKFYREYFPFSINYERGETWFTPIALLENIYDYRIYNKIKFDVNKKPYNKNGSSQLKQYKIELISAISRKICEGKNIGVDFHCLANFGCIPSELNTWQGGEDYGNIKKGLPPRLDIYNRSRLGDFPDLFFICVKNYLTDKSEDGYNPAIEGKKLREFDWWFERIGEGKKCSWKDFVDKMHLKGSFVDENYEVMKLFDHTIGNPFPNLQVIINKKMENGYTINNLSEKLSGDTQIKKCIENIYTIWNNRAAHFRDIAFISPFCS